MFTLKANIGDIVDVTIISATKGLQAEESINGKRAYLDSRSLKPRPGDRCKVKIVGQNPSHTVYFVTVMQVVRLGFGGKSLLQHVCLAIERAPRNKQHQNKTEAAVTMAEAYFGADTDGLLAFFVTVAGHYTPDVDSVDSYRVDMTAILAAAGKLIEQLTAKNPEQAFKACFDMSSTCFARGQHDLSEKLLLQALSIFGAQSPRVEQALLELEYRYQENKTSTGQEERLVRQIDAVERLLKINEAGGALDSDRRRHLAGLYRQANRTSQARLLVQPLVADKTNLEQCKDAQALREIAEVCAADSDYETAREILELALSVTRPDDSITGSLQENLAEACLYLGDFQRAALLFREALHASQGELDEMYNANY